jgi:hypothetical protein
VRVLIFMRDLVHEEIFIGTRQEEIKNISPSLVSGFTIMSLRHIEFCKGQMG